MEEETKEGKRCYSTGFEDGARDQERKLGRYPVKAGKYME